MNFVYCPKCGRKGTVQKLSDTDYECSACAWHFWNNAKAATGVFLLRKDGTFLASKRGREPYKGRYDVPGGFVEYNEDPPLAAVREVFEETGATIKNPVLLAGISSIYTPDTLPPVSTADFIFAVTEWEGEPKAGDDVAELEWKSLDFMKNEEFVLAYPDDLPEKLQNLIAAR